MQKIPMRDTKAHRAITIQLQNCPMSHSGTHSCTTRGHRTVHSQMFCPVTAHSPTAEVCMQQVVPNQLHIRALLSRKTLSHSSTSRSFNFPSGLWICCLHYIPSYLVCQWVNSSFLQIEFSARCAARICGRALCSCNRSHTFSFLRRTFSIP